jgi:ABC-type polar amino acid transport system ATPase subunit
MKWRDGLAILVEVRGLTKYFAQRGGLFGLRAQPAVRAVDGVSLTVKRQETLGVVGESGCGKTTLGRCILRLIEPTGGEVLFEGVNILTLGPTEMRRRWRDMQMVFQNPFSSLNPRLNVLSLVSEPLRTHTDLRGEELAEQVVGLLERVGLKKEHLYRYSHEFSGGQCQRIAVARALARTVLRGRGGSNASLLPDPVVLPLGKRAARQADGAAGKGWRRKRRPTCNGLDRGWAYGRHHPTRKRADFLLVLRHEKVDGNVETGVRRIKYFTPGMDGMEQVSPIEKL